MSLCSYSSLLLVDREEFQMSFMKEKKDMIEKGRLSKWPSLQEVKKRVECYGAHVENF